MARGVQPNIRDGFLLFDANADGQDDLVVPTLLLQDLDDPNLLVFDWESFDPSSLIIANQNLWLRQKMVQRLL
jgi:hypothetical protein